MTLISRRRFRRHETTTFLLAFALGVCLALFHRIVFVADSPPWEQEESVTYDDVDHRIEYDRWLSKTEGLQSVHVDPDINRYTSTYVNDSEFVFLKNRVPVYCLVIPESEKGAIAVKQTWGRRCNDLFFYSSKIENETIPITKLKSAKSSFEVLCRSFRQIYPSIDRNSSSWLFVATEDTFVIVENFRYFVAPRDANRNYYLGHGMTFWNENYNWEEAGFALSAGALGTFLTEFDTDDKCSSGGKYWKNGDWYLGKHLGRLGIKPEDTRDHLGKGRFNGYPMQRMLFPGGISIFERYWKDSLFTPNPDGPTCCSNHAITFHGVTSISKIYQMNYLFYNLRPFYAGGSHGNRPPPPEIKSPEKPLTWDETLKEKWRIPYILGSKPPSH